VAARARNRWLLLRDKYREPHILERIWCGDEAPSWSTSYHNSWKRSIAAFAAELSSTSQEEEPPSSLYRTFATSRCAEVLECGSERVANAQVTHENFDGFLGRRTSCQTRVLRERVVLCRTESLSTYGALSV
jgi:hypothetical protein